MRGALFVAHQDQLDLRVDERIEDGLYAGYGIKQVKKLLEDPVKGGIAAGDDVVLAALARDEAAGAEPA